MGSFIPIGHVCACVLVVYVHTHAFTRSCNKVLVKKAKISTIATFTDLPLYNKWEETLS